MSLPPTIALGSIFTECNHFGGAPTDLACFERYDLRRGDEIRGHTTGTVGGMLQVLKQTGAEVRPTLVASACPGGPLTPECYRRLKTELLERLQATLPVDGVLLALHGSATADDVGDLEGDLLQAVRERIGPKIPIVGTLDLHAHVTKQMIENADALLAWETYPHKDAFTTGERGARILLDIVARRCRPTMALAKVPVIVSGVHGHTEGPGPFADVMRFAKSHEGKEDVLSTNAFLVHPYLDLPDMGGGGLVITDNNMPKATALAEEIARRYWERRFDLDPPVWTPEAAVHRGLDPAPPSLPFSPATAGTGGGPTLLVETSDCCGGGAAGDSVAALRVLLEHAPDSAALVPVVDPEAAELAHKTGVGREVTVALGHKLDPRWGKPLTFTALIARLGDGRFRYTGGIWGGQEAHMGPSAVLERGPIRILVMSHATYDWADEQYHSFDLDVSGMRFVVVKNPMNYRIGYAGRYREALILDTPGPTPATLHHVKLQHVRRPYYPADREIPGLQPTVATH